MKQVKRQMEMDCIVLTPKAGRLSEFIPGAHFVCLPTHSWAPGKARQGKAAQPNPTQPNQDADPFASHSSCFSGADKSQGSSHWTFRQLKPGEHKKC